MPLTRFVPAFFRDDKTKEILTRKQFIDRETNEWEAAFKTFTKEVLGGPSRVSNKMLVTSEKELRFLAHHLDPNRHGKKKTSRR